MTAGVLIVDAANVVGSRPDGWWRDRAGAAERLVDRISAAVGAEALSGPVEVVLEGAARNAVNQDVGGAIRLVRAPGSGDDAIVGLVSRSSPQATTVTVVTADRGLRARVERLGARVAPPSWFLDLLGGSGGR